MTPTLLQANGNIDFYFTAVVTVHSTLLVSGRPNPGTQLVHTHTKYVDVVRSRGHCHAVIVQSQRMADLGLVSIQLAFKGHLSGHSVAIMESGSIHLSNEILHLLYRSCISAPT